MPTSYSAAGGHQREPAAPRVTRGHGHEVQASLSRTQQPRVGKAGLVQSWRESGTAPLLLALVLAELVSTLWREDADAAAEWQNLRSRCGAVAVADELLRNSRCAVLESEERDASDFVGLCVRRGGVCGFHRLPPAAKGVLGVRRRRPRKDEEWNGMDQGGQCRTASQTFSFDLHPPVGHCSPTPAMASSLLTNASSMLRMRAYTCLPGNMLRTACTRLFLSSNRFIWVRVGCVVVTLRAPCARTAARPRAEPGDDN